MLIRSAPLLATPILIRLDLPLSWTSRRPLSTMTQPGVKVRKLNRDSYPEKIVITEEDLRRQDESPDGQWYDEPRFVQHIDDGFVASTLLFES